MKNTYIAKILENREIASGIFNMVLEAEGLAAAAQCGQFIAIYIDDGVRLLPRPISICEILGSSIRLIYRIEGEGTKIISKKSQNDELRILAPLGNGFSVPTGDNFAIFGGGIGVPPLLELAKAIKKLNPKATIDVFLGFLSKEFVILEKEFENYANVYISTDDGSYGHKGNVIENFYNANGKAQPLYDAAYACGPTPMLRAVASVITSKLYLSLEERMACVVGACLACVVKKQDGTRARVCVDGPIFEAKELAL